MLHNISHNALQPVTKLGLASVREIWRNRAFTLVLVDNPSIHPSIGTILFAERWCCLGSLLGYWAQSWTGRHSDTGY